MAGETVLVVDDDPSSAHYVALTLEQAGYRAIVAHSIDEALLVVARRAPSLLFSDLCMPGGDGLELLSRLEAAAPEIPVVMVTVVESVQTIVEVIRRGAINYLVKPVAPPLLVEAAARALSHGKALPLADHPSGIVGASAPMAEVHRMVALAARSDVNVVITGETGTGKELVARAIHRQSMLADKPFVAHNCALTASDLFDSELFGHRRGAFTGADRDRVGLLRHAHGGMLFLDELECLSLGNQAKLLRVLDDGEVRPIGSDRSFPVSVRFLAATNRSPDAMFTDGQLREDFYYRLCGFLIVLPPLRERIVDVGLLAEHFLADRASLAPPALDALESYHWPGNVRQLRNVLRGAVSRCGGTLIQANDIDLQWGKGGSTPPPSHVPERTLEGLERQAILAALASHQGNRSQTAAALGIHRSTLHRKLRELAIEPLSPKARTEPKP
jgi:DNA-binding NtrC family response regulator